MNDIVLYHQFSGAGITNHTKRNFQYTEFLNIQADDPNNPLNFYRSDFRSTIFRDSKFHCASFNNADFVGSTISKCFFNECTFQSAAFVDSMLKDTIFQKNMKTSYEIVRCQLSNVKFFEENLFRAVLRNSNFFNCQFAATTIKRSSLEDISFEGCNFGGLDLVPVYAVDLRFLKCDMSGVSVDPDYLGSYLFDRESFEGIKFGYKGKSLKFDFLKEDDRSSFIKHLGENGRLIDVALVTLLSFHILGGQNSVSRIICAAVDQALSERNSLTVAYGIKRIWGAIKFYSELRSVSVSDLIAIHAHFSDLHQDDCPIIVQAEIRNAIAEISRSIFSIDAHAEQFDSHAESRLVITEFEFDTNDEKEALFILEEMFHEFALIKNDKGAHKFYQITRIRQGSIIIEVVTGFILIQIVVNAIKSVNLGFQQIRIDSTYSKKIRSLIEGASTMKELSSISEQHTRIQSRSLSKIREEFTHSLSKLKSIRIGFDDR